MFQTFVDVSPRKCVVPNLLQQIVGNPCALPDWSKMKVFQPPTRGHWERLQTFFHTVMSIYLGSLILDSLGYVWAINLDVMHRRRLSWLLGIHGLSRVKWIINATGKVGEKWKPSHFMGIFGGIIQVASFFGFSNWGFFLRVSTYIVKVFYSFAKHYIGFFLNYIRFLGRITADDQRLGPKISWVMDG